MTTGKVAAIAKSMLGSGVSSAVADYLDEHPDIFTDYAKVDGSYSSLTAGNAEQLVSTVGVTDKTPYLFRTTGGSADVGDRVKVSEITGGTVAWNQLVQNGDFSVTTGETKWSVRQTGGAEYVNGEFKLNAVTTNANNQFSQSISFLKDHKYLVWCDAYKGADSTVASFSVGLATDNGFNVSKSFTLSTSKTRFVGMLTYNGASNNLRFRMDDVRITIGDAVYFDDVNVFDLTAKFGSTIADYLYTLESGTAGAGIAKLKSWGFCTKPYYAYDAGTPLSVKTTAHKTIGFNAYNPDTGKAKVVGGQAYQITGTYTALSLDGTSITPDASGYFTPAASGELTVTGGNSTDTCIHLKWDGERDGEYEPYVAHEYALGDTTLRGKLKLDANNNLYADGDIYPPSGEVRRRYSIVDLGTLNWASSVPGQFLYEDASFDGASDPNGESMICSSVLMGGNAYDGNADNVICARVATYKRLWVKCSAYSTADSFKTAMSGVYLVYKLATPTTESADPYQETQICNGFGTEEFVDSRTVPMPVGANALYQANLRAKLEMAPDSPSGNGDYIVRQTDGLNEYVLLEKELPTAPAEDGTYSLKCTVADGTATLSWVSDS